MDGKKEREETSMACREGGSYRPIKKRVRVHEFEITGTCKVAEVNLNKTDPISSSVEDLTKYWTIEDNSHQFEYQLRELIDQLFVRLLDCQIFG